MAEEGSAPSGGGSSRFGRWLMGATLRMSGRHALVLTAVGLAICWVVTMAFGGASKVPPHSFYVPILFAGIRFGAWGALGAAVASTALAGPLSYADVSAGTAQAAMDWGSRGVYFVLIGQALTAVATLNSHAAAKELSDLRAAKGLWTALDRGRFEVYFQPVVSMAGAGEVVGAEALVRLHDAERGLVAPDQFIPLAEQTGMIRPLGAWVLRSACAEVARWRTAGLVGPHFTLAVNVSARELEAPSFCEGVSDVLHQTGLAPSMLFLEITETAVAEDPERFINALHGLHRLGIGLALDDFGIGHSSLAEVQRLPVDVIKIDKSFVATLGHGEHGSAIARNIVSLAASLDVFTVVEGVETSEQADILTRMGCDLAQGYLFGRPVPADAFELGLASTAKVISPSAPQELGHRSVSRYVERATR
jgi:EAL domain-containing protein (putative c-di-GMP-specific phosphodiesterase class I)